MRSHMSVFAWRGFLYFVVLLALIACPALATPQGLVFQMTADGGKTTLDVGESVWVTVSAWVNDPCGVSGNGLWDYQLDMDVLEGNNNGNDVVEIVADASNNFDLLTIENPNPWDTIFSQLYSINQDVSGELWSLYIINNYLSPTADIGVGGYTDLFKFKIEAKNTGTATYTIGLDAQNTDLGKDFYGSLETAGTFDLGQNNIWFDTETSNYIFTVVPEPASLLMAAMLTGLYYRRKRR